MTIPKPIKVEKAYLRLYRELGAVQSRQSQLLLIDQFLAFIEGAMDRYESYVLELISDVPSISYPLIIAGMEPQRMVHICQRFERLQERGRELEYIQEFREVKKMLQAGCLVLYTFVEDPAAGLEALGIELEEDRGGLKAQSNGESSPSLACLFEKLQSALKTEGRLYVQQKISGMLYRNGFTATSPISLIWPVIEKKDKPLLQEKNGAVNNEAFLRQIDLEITGTYKNGDDQINVSNVVVGARTEQRSRLKVPMRAARKLIRQRHPDLSACRLAGQIHCTPDGFVTFDHSEHLPLAALLYNAFLRNRQTQIAHKFRTNSTLIGGIDESGTIEKIKQPHLAKKIHTVFYSWIQQVVVPEEQRGFACEIRDNLLQKYPHKTLKVIGMSSLEQIFTHQHVTADDRRTVRDTSWPDIMPFSLKWIWIIIALIIFIVLYYI